LVKSTHPNSSTNPRRINTKRSTTRHIIIKLLRAEGKERILKRARDKPFITYKGLIKLTADFSSETMEAKRDKDDNLKC